eukprot:gene13355-19198_t
MAGFETGRASIAAVWTLLMVSMISMISLSSAVEDPLKLLLATGTRLMWYTPSTGDEQVIREGGVHYGLVPGKKDNLGKLLTVWAVVRFENGSDNKNEFLVEIDAIKGGELGRVQIRSSGTHDAVLHGDRVYAANTVDAKLMEFKYPSMELVKGHKLFTEDDHLNTIAPINDTEMWVMLHMRGKSKLQKLNRMADGSFKRVSWIRGFGEECHAIVWHNDSFLVLDSLGGRLMRVKPDGCWEAVYVDPFGNRFFKGLNVVDDIAYFGMSVKAKRENRLYPTAHGELAAYHLVEKRLLWRKVVHTSGLLNVVAAPQLGISSTYKAQVTSHPPDIAKLLQGSTLGPVSDSVVIAAAKVFDDLGFSPKNTGKWPSGAPMMDLALKASKNEIWDAGVYLPMGEVMSAPSRPNWRPFLPDLWDVNIAATANELWDVTVAATANIIDQELWDVDIAATANVIDQELWDVDIAATANVIDQVAFCPEQRWSSSSDKGSRTKLSKVISLIYSKPTKGGSYKLPYYDFFSLELEPLIKTLLGKDGLNYISRMAMEKLDHGLPFHRDPGTLPGKNHRIYVPITECTIQLESQLCPQPDKLSLGQSVILLEKEMKSDDCIRIPERVGVAYELNNRILHQIKGESVEKGCVLLVIDATDPGGKLALPVNGKKKERDQINENSLEIS